MSAARAFCKFTVFSEKLCYTVMQANKRTQSSKTSASLNITSICVRRNVNTFFVSIKAL